MTEGTSDGVDISAKKNGKAEDGSANGDHESEKNDHGSGKSDHVPANGDHNMLTMNKADKPGNQETSEEIAKLKTVIRNLHGEIDDLDYEKEQLEAEYGNLKEDFRILKEDFRRTKALSKIDATLIKEMREFYYGDKEVAPEEGAEMARLKAENVRLTQKLFEVEGNYFKLQNEVYDLKMVNQKMVADRLGFSGLPRF